MHVLRKVTAHEQDEAHTTPTSRVAKTVNADAGLQQLATLATHLFSVDACVINLAPVCAEAFRRQLRFTSLSINAVEVSFDDAAGSTVCKALFPGTVPTSSARTALLDCHGLGLGSITVLNSRSARRFTARQQEALRQFASLVSQAVEARVTAHEEMPTPLPRRERLKLVQKLPESSTDCVFQLDGRWRFTSLNPAAVAAIGGGADLLGTIFWDAFPAFIGTEREACFRRALEQRSAVMFEEFDAATGGYFEVHVHPSGEGVAVHFRNSSLQRVAALELKKLNARSGLGDRASMIKCIEARSVAGVTPEKTFALLSADLEFFHRINDCYGKRGGDAVLHEVGVRICGTLAGDTLSIAARTDGDGFAVLLANVAAVEDVLTYAQCLQHILREPIRYEGKDIHVCACIGISIADEGSFTANQMMENADVALHTAKACGPCATAVFSPQMRAHTVQRFELEADLRHAVAREQLVLHYQPKVTLRDSRVTGYEALVRWSHPTRGMIPPNDFIPYAEESGLIIEIGDWTLCEALRQIAAWRRSGQCGPEVTMAVNLSTSQFGDPRLLKKVKEALAMHDVPPSCLTLEVTESAMIGNIAHAKETLEQLRALGVGLDLDDFGTGYSSLSYLHQLPFDTLKIDRSFTKNLETCAESRAIARSVMQLGKSLNLAVVAEGIETIEQQRALMAMGCTQGQGYLFSKPLPAASIEERFCRIHLPTTLAFVGQVRA